MTSSSFTPPTTDLDFDGADVNQQGWLDKVRELIKYRYLLYNLIIRDLKVRYKNSLLGVLWSLLNPLLMMLVFTLVFTAMWPADIPQYPVFVLVGLLPWNFFTGALMGGTVSISGNGALIKKVYFPREMLPLSAVLSGLVNFLIAFLVLLAFLFAYDLGLSRHALWVPVILATQVIFTAGLVLFLSALHVFYRDVVMMLDAVILAWFFLTPILYPLEWLNERGLILGQIEPAVVMRWLNPMASIVDAYRTVLWGTMSAAGSGPASMDPGFFIRTLLTSILILIVGYLFFNRAQYLFGEKL